MDDKPLETANEIEYLFHLQQKRRELSRKLATDLGERNAAWLKIDNQIARLEARIESKLGI